MLMDIKDLALWCSDRDNLTKNSSIECNECLSWVKVYNWKVVIFKAIYVEYGTPSDRPHLICPECEQMIDYNTAPLLRHRL